MIVGIVSVIGLSIFRFPYAMLIGVVMGVTNIIPFFGPFIGAVPGVFLPVSYTHLTLPTTSRV